MSNDSSAKPTGTPGRRERLARELHRKLWSLEQHVDRVRDRYLPARMPRQLVAYRGYVAGGVARLSGRVLADEKRGGPLANDHALVNLRSTYRRFATREVPNVRVQVEFLGVNAETETDEEGYWNVAIEVKPEPGPLWREAIARLPAFDIESMQTVMVVPHDAKFALVSDIDDTVLESSITNWRTAMALTFLYNARTRKPLEGAAELYQSLQRAGEQEPKNPVFYVSSSPWNLYDLLDEFMTVNQLPHGPIFLRDLGIDDTKLFKPKGHVAKLDHVRRLMQEFPELPFVLVGDSGQHDAELYATAAKEFPQRIRSIYIRDVDPAADSSYDRYVDTQIEQVRAAGVPFLRVRDSVAIAEHATTVGLLPAKSVAPVVEDAARDAERPSLTEAAAIPPAPETDQTAVTPAAAAADKHPDSALPGASKTASGGGTPVAP